MVALQPAGEIAGQDGGKSVFDAALPGRPLLVVAYAGILGSPSGVTGGRLVALLRHRAVPIGIPLAAPKRTYSGNTRKRV